MPESGLVTNTDVPAERSIRRLGRRIGVGSFVIGAATGATAGYEAAQGQLPGTLALGFVALNFLVVSGGTLWMSRQPQGEAGMPVSRQTSG